MRKDFQIALLCACSTIPAGLAVTAAFEYFPVLKQHIGASFYVNLVITALLLSAAIVIAIRGERAAERAGAEKRMIPLIGMIVSGICFLGFGAWYFWPAVPETDGYPIAWFRTVRMQG